VDACKASLSGFDSRAALLEEKYRLEFTEQDDETVIATVYRMVSEQNGPVERGRERVVAQQSFPAAGLTMATVRAWVRDEYRKAREANASRFILENGSRHEFEEKDLQVKRNT
jgi:hypothetical protein